MSKIIVEKEMLMKFFISLKEDIDNLGITMNEKDRILIDVLLIDHFSDFIKLNNIKEANSSCTGIEKEEFQAKLYEILHDDDVNL